LFETFLILRRVQRDIIININISDSYACVLKIAQSDTGLRLLTVIYANVSMA